MSDLRKKLIRLAHENPGKVRDAILPLLKQADLRLSKKDKEVIKAFADKKSAESKKLTSDGKRLDGNWMGGRGIAQWKGGKIEVRDLGSRSADTVARALRKLAPKFDFAKQAAKLTDIERPAQDLVNLSRDLYRLVGRVESAARRAKSSRPGLALAVLKQIQPIDRLARKLSMDVDEELGLY